MGLLVVAVLLAWGDGVLLRPPRQQISPMEPQPPPATEFFSERNRADVTVPARMPAIDLIRLYQLETSRDETLDAAGRDEGDVLEPGSVIRATLTPRDGGGDGDSARGSGNR
jgi:hypothetical protein